MQITAEAASVSDVLQALADSVDLATENDWRIGLHMESFIDQSSSQRVYSGTLFISA